MALDRNGGGVTRRTFVKGGLAASALAALAACGKNENAASNQGGSTVKASDGGTFKYYISDPVAIDPYNLQESEGTQVGHVLFDSLVEWDWTSPTSRPRLPRPGRSATTTPSSPSTSRMPSSTTATP